MTKHSTVYYTNSAGMFRARVMTVHRDGSYTVKALFAMNADGSDRIGYLGFNYCVSGDVLRTAF